MKFSTAFVTAALTFALLFNGATATTWLRASNPSDSGEGETAATPELRFPGKIGDLKTMKNEMMNIKDSLEFSDSYFADPCNGVECGGVCYHRAGDPGAVDFGMCDGAGECRPYNDAGEDEAEYLNFYVSDLMETCPRHLGGLDDFACGFDCGFSCGAEIFRYFKCVKACTAKC